MYLLKFMQHEYNYQKKKSCLEGKTYKAKNIFYTTYRHVQNRKSIALE